MSKISVIIPTYQHGDTIAACLDSVFSQTHKDIEVIVVDDGSTDNTQEELKRFSGRIRTITIANSGAPKARNTGFAASTGEYVIFLDADVVADKNMLAVLLQTLAEHPEASYSYGGFRFGWARFKALSWDADRLRDRNFIHTSALIRRADFPGFDESIKKLQDWDLWLTMLERGKTGVSAGKIMFSAKPRGKLGMSQWLPKIFYSKFLNVLGIKFRPVERYNQAAEIVRKKHGLNETAESPRGDKLWLWFLAVFAVSGLSFAYAPLGTVFSLIYLIITLKTALKRLIYGVGFVLAELIFGSLAGKTLVIAFDDFSLPLRFAIFAAVGIVWLVRLAQKRIRWPEKNIAIAIILLFAAVGWGIVSGFLHHTPLREIFFDANAYFALPLILFFFSATEEENDQALLRRVLKNGAIAISIITIVAMYFFSHKFPNMGGVFAYKWLRDSRIAEITALDGGIYRVFIQSQLFCLMAFLYVLMGDRFKGIKSWWWGILPATALVISGSRSFALGLLAAGVTWLVILIVMRAKNVFARTAGKLAVFAAIALALYVLMLFIPVPALRSQTSFLDMLRSRSVSDRDAATTSRWALLKVLNEKIAASPVFGSGFGASVTYQSSDPRIVSTTGGTYTTSAFEWNYHDIIVKMGFLGLAAYGYLLYVIFAVLRKSEPRKRLWLVPAFFALLALNAVSPYLNHPLGIGYLALLLALAQSKSGEPAPVVAAEKIRARAPAMAANAGVAMTSEE